MSFIALGRANRWACLMVAAGIALGGACFHVVGPGGETSTITQIEIDSVHAASHTMRCGSCARSFSLFAGK